MSQSTHSMMRLFSGYGGAYGLYQLTGEKKGPKCIGKAVTVREPVSIDLWNKHLDGHTGLGVIPINEDSNVIFCAIDIDKYNVIKHDELIKRIAKLKFPLVTVRSKSGGYHLYLFLKALEPAAYIVPMLKEIASQIGYGDAEIFPKQTQLLAERGDIGQWINMPYFNKSNTERYAWGDDYEKLSLTEFLEYAKTKQTTSEDLRKLLKPVDVLKGAPPCLNQLVTQGFPNGTRNNGLFNLGVYCRKSNPDNWQVAIDELNTQYMDPPLPSGEVLGVIKSLNKKDYQYSCKQPPLNAFCNQGKCRMCQFGIGEASGMPAMGSLTKLDADPPIWFVELEGGGRIELSTDQLQSARLFQKRCMEVTNTMPSIPKHAVWEGIVQELLMDVNVIAMPKDVSPTGRLLEYLETFCTSKVIAYSPDGLLLGKPYSWDGHILFRMKDFLVFLDRMRFQEFRPARIAMIIRDCLHGVPEQIHVKGKCLSVWKIKEYEKITDQLALPPGVKSKEIPY